MHPFVAPASRRPEYHPNKAEVEAVLEVPLSHLADPGNLFSELRTVLNGVHQVPYFGFGSDKIWGATAMLLDDLITRLQMGMK